MLLLRAAYVRAPSQIDIALWARQLPRWNRPSLLQHRGRNGQIVDSSLGMPVEPIDMSPLDVVREQLDGREDRLLISIPVMDQLVHRRCIEFTRPIITADGDPWGHCSCGGSSPANGSVSPLKFGHGSLDLVGLDGIVRADALSGGEAIGRDVSRVALFGEALRRESGTVMAPGMVMERSASAASSVTGYPLVVFVGLDTRDEFARWSHYRRQYLAGGAVLSVLALGIGTLLLLGRLRLLRSRRTLGAAIENIGQGLVMVSNLGRILVVNRRAADMLGGIPAAFPVPLASGEHEDRCPDGRILEVRTQELPDGGPCASIAMSPSVGKARSASAIWRGTTRSLASAIGCCSMKRWPR